MAIFDTSDGGCLMNEVGDEAKVYWLPLTGGDCWPLLVGGVTPIGFTYRLNSTSLSFGCLGGDCGECSLEKVDMAALEESGGTCHSLEGRTSIRFAFWSR